MEELEPTIGEGLYQNKKVFEAETVYEVTTQQNGLPFGIAIADIQQSKAHFHKDTWETYTVVQGNLELYLDGERHVLHPGDVKKIPLWVVHYAKSLDKTPARITVTTIPEFSPEDYFVVEDDKEDGEDATQP
jgi:mannose-6-phosphate isomerase-like protein (cupin superfamily)